MDACWKPCQESLAVTLHSLPVLVFLQRERKTKIATEDKEMSMFPLSRRRRGASEVVWSFLGKGTIMTAGSQTRSPVLSCFLRMCARPAQASARIPTRPACLLLRAAECPGGVFWGEVYFGLFIYVHH